MGYSAIPNINDRYRNGLDELEIQIRDSNAYVLGEKDLITVYLEFNGLTEEDSQVLPTFSSLLRSKAFEGVALTHFQRYFGISKFELGSFLYDRIREKMEFENPTVSEFETPKGYYL